MKLFLVAASQTGQGEQGHDGEALLEHWS